MFGFSKNLQGKTYLTIGLVGARYGRHPRTIRRWQRSGVGFPPADMEINGLDYWLPETLDQFDAGRKPKATAA